MPLQPAYDGKNRTMVSISQEFQSLTLHQGGPQADDAIARQLREIEGVPKAPWVVKNFRVFAFEKLLWLVKNCTSSANQGKELRADDVLTLLPAAWIDPITAVEKWGIIPEPYTVDTDGQAFFIRHQPFNAVVPEVYRNSRDLTLALAHMLVGGVIGEFGDVCYRGQYLSLKGSPLTKQLPVSPRLDTADIARPELGNSPLLNIGYEPGFAPLTPTLFERVKSLDLTWRGDSHAVRRFITSHSKHLGPTINQFGVHQLTHPSRELIDEADSDLIDIRRMFPELDAMSAHALFNWFADYQRDCRFKGAIDARRDDGFFHYLLGQLASNGELIGEHAERVGTYAAFAVARGARPLAALRLGMQCDRYHNSLDKLVSNTVSVLTFLKEDSLHC